MHILSSRWFKVVISLCLFALLLRSIDLRAFRERLTDAQWGWMVPAFIGYLLSQVLSAYKWQVLARPLGFRQSFRTFVIYYFSGMYLNLFAPSTVVGDLGRSAFLAQGKAQLGLAVQSVLADRITGLTMLLWVGALGVLFADAVPFPLPWRLGVVASALGMTAVWFFIPHVLRRFFQRTHKVRRALEQLVGPYQNVRWVLLHACSISLLFHFFQLSLQLMIAQALSLEAPFGYLLICIPLINLLSGLPISFGGLGVREGSCVMFLSLVGVSSERALAFGVLWSVLVVGANATGGLALLLAPTSRLPLAKVKKMQDE